MTCYNEHATGSYKETNGSLCLALSSIPADLSYLFLPFPQWMASVPRPLKVLEFRVAAEFGLQ